MWEYMNNNDFSWEPKSVMGRAESALKRDFAEERLVLDIMVRCMRLGNRRRKKTSTLHRPIFLWLRLSPRQIVSFYILVEKNPFLCAIFST